MKQKNKQKEIFKLIIPKIVGIIVFGFIIYSILPNSIGTVTDYKWVLMSLIVSAQPLILWSYYLQLDKRVRRGR